MSIIAGTAIESALGAYQLDYGVRFNSADTAYLSRTPATAGNRRTWTISVWLKRSLLGGDAWVYDGGTSGNASGFEFSSDKIRIHSTSSSGAVDDVDVRTTAVYRDVSSWYHVVLAVDTTQATNTNRIKLYVNGVQVTSFSTTTWPTQNYDFGVNNNNAQKIGKWNPGSGRDFDGYMADFNLIDGQQLTASDFGQPNTTTGVWEPIQYDGTYGTNGFYLPFNQEYPSINADFLVVAGGGGGSSYGAGGAGGYRTSAGTSGGGASAESSLSLAVGYPHIVTVGGGGSGAADANGVKGSNSVLSSITSTGGGYGGNGNVGGTGGSGGGGGAGLSPGNAGGSGTTSQGYAGGRGLTDDITYTAGGGGGGAGATGTNAAYQSGGTGGNGVASSITGSSVTRAGGGGGRTNVGTSGSGGSGGGGSGGTSSIGGSGTVNTGGGGGGGQSASGGGGAGGSGIVIVKLPDTHSAVFSSGVTYSRSTAVSGYNIYSVTATSTTSETMTLQQGFTASFLVVAGGGGGGRRCGGGAGGYRSAYSTENTGGGQPAESPLSISLGTAYTITVGAGGAGTVETNDNTVTQGYNGSNSVFSSITSTGGGAGSTQLNSAGNGGSGGGGGDGSTTGLGTSGQGYAGGTSGAPGGGGSAAVGVSASPGAGGSGQASSITGSSVARGGGGGGSSNSSGAGGYGGGGAGATYNGYNAQSGTANTGGGGGSTGGGASTAYGGNGGSGVVVIRVPADVTATFSGGVTSSSTTSGGYNIYTVTATSTTSETVTFS